MVLVLVLAALVVGVAAAGTVLHLHDQGGLWNEEHDLALLATTSPWAPCDVTPAVVTRPSVTPVPAPVVARVPHATVGSALSRAPPTA